MKLKSPYIKTSFLFILTVSLVYNAAAVDRYWVGGNGNWDGTTTTHWSSNSGGAGGSSVPTSSDNVFFDGNSGAGTATIITTIAFCKNLNFTGYTGEFSGSERIQVSGNLILSATMTYSHTGQLSFMTNASITSNGNTFTCGLISNQYSISLNDDFISTGAFFLADAGNSPSFNSNNHNVTCAAFAVSNLGITGNLGNGIYTITGDDSIYGFTCIFGPLSIINAGTSTIKFTSNSANPKTFRGGGYTYYNFWNATSGGGALIITGSNTFNNFKADAGTKTNFTDGTTQTISSITALGALGNEILLTGTSTGGWTILDGSGTNNVNYCNISYSNAIGGASWNATNSADGGNNTGWDFHKRYWVGGSGNWDATTTTHWSTSSGGIGGAPVPTSSNDVYFDANSGNGTVTLLNGSQSCLSLDFTGFTGTLTGTIILKIYGSLTLGSGMTVTYNTSPPLFELWAISGFHTITTNGVKLYNLTTGTNGGGGTFSLQDDYEATSIQIGGGIFNTNNKNINVNAFRRYGTYTSIINLGASIITCSLPTGNSWQIDSPTNLTFNCGTSTIKFSGDNYTFDQTFLGAGLTYNNFWNNTTGSGAVIISGSNTFNNFKSDANRIIKFTDGTIQTVVSTTLAGAAGNLITLQGTSTGGWTISDFTGTNYADYCNISNSTATGGALFNATNSIDAGNNSGWIFGMAPNYPYNPSLNVSNNASTEWSYGGSYQLSQITNNFSGEINNFLANYNGNNSSVLVPIKLHSDNAGVLKITDLNIQYLYADTIRPSFVDAKLVPASLAKNSTFSVRVKVADNDKVDSVRATFKNTVYNLTEVSIDSFTVSILADTVGDFPVTITVSDTDGLRRDTVLFVTVYSSTQDLEVLNSNLNVLPVTIFTNDSVNLTSIVKNNSNLTATNVQVALIIDGVTQQIKTITLGPLAQTEVNFDWLAKWSQDTVIIKADPSNLINEANENNNTGTKYIFVNDIYPPQILQALAVPNPVYVNNPVLFKVKAIDSTGIASVTVNWQSQNVNLTYNPSTEFYEGNVNANTVGISNAIITAYDANNLSSNTLISIQVLQNLPDLKIFQSGISFMPSTSPGGTSSTISLKVYNTGNIDISNASLKLAVDGVTIQTENISVLHDSSITANFNYIMSCGNHNFTAIIDSSNLINEVNETNNTATVSHQFCPNQVQYSLAALAVPALVSLGSSVQLRANPSPLIATATVNTFWNNQNLAMTYNNGMTAYIVSVTPSQTGSYLVPITLLDSNNAQVTVFVQFTVIDSLPDVSVNNLSPVSYPVTTNGNSIFNVQVSNNGFQNLSNVAVHFAVDGTLVDSTVLTSLVAFDTVSVSFNWLAQSGTHTITSTADSHNQIAESSETNNTKTISLSLTDNQPPVIEYVQLSSPIYQGGILNIECFITDNDSITSVIGHFMGNNFSLAYDSLSQTWKATVNTPASGTYTLGITATDSYSLTAYSSVAVQVNLLLADLEMLPQHIIYNRVDSVLNNATVIIINIGGTVAGNTKVLLFFNGTAIDSSSISIGAGQRDTIIFPFTAPIGFHTLTVKLDPYNTITESNESNNIAPRNIFIPDLTPPPSPVVTINPAIWSGNQNFAVSWTSVIDNTGAVTYEISVNGNSWTNIDSSLSTNVIAIFEGVNYVYIRAKDSSGNVGAPAVGVMKYDNTAPNAPLIAEYHCGTSWTTHESPYLEWINPGDIGSGIEFFEVSIDSQTPINIGFSLTYHDTLTSGSHTLKIRATDYVGHHSAWSNLITVHIDLDSPACPILTSPTHPNQNQWYHNDSLVLNWTPPTETSSITGYFYMLNRDSIYYADQTAYWIGADTLIITAIPSMDTSRIRIPDGVWYVHVSSQDTVGHVTSNSCNYKFKLDKTPPFTVTNNLDTVSACTYKFTLHAEDYYSGVESTHYRINNAAWVNDTIVTLNQNGLNRIEFYSKDTAGNIENVDTVSVYLIKPPVCENTEDSICNTGVVFIASSIIASGSTYQWQESRNTTFNNLTNTGIYSDVTTDTLKLTSMPSSYYGYQYRCIITTGTHHDTSLIYKIHIVNTWTGALSTAWEDIGNWSCNSLPDSNTDVKIITGSLRYPQVNSFAICRSIQVQPGAVVLVKQGYKLDITK